MAENASIAEVMSKVEADLDVSRGTEPEKTDRPEKQERSPVNRGSKHKPEPRETKTLSLRDIPAPGEIAPAAAEPVKEWEQPGWSKNWKKERADALRKLATHPELGGDASQIIESFNEAYNVIGRSEWNRGQLEKKLQPISDILSEMEQSANLSGQGLPQHLSQLHAVSRSLAADPDSTLPWLASMYKPRDPAKALQALSQAWGTDLGQVAQGSPYVDPAIQSLVMPLVNRLQSIEAQQSQRDNYQMQQLQNNVLSQIDAFENAKDEHGTLLHPYFKDPEVFQAMMYAANSGKSRNIHEAYAWAIQYHPQAQQDRVKQAEQQALQQAAQTTRVARQASGASNNVSGASRPRDTQPRTREEAMRMAERQLGG